MGTGLRVEARCRGFFSLLERESVGMCPVFAIIFCKIAIIFL
jgi:hypothetical protein